MRQPLSGVQIKEVWGVLNLPKFQILLESRFQGKILLKPPPPPYEARLCISEGRHHDKRAQFSPRNEKILHILFEYAPSFILLLQMDNV